VSTWYSLNSSFSARRALSQEYVKRVIDEVMGEDWSDSVNTVLQPDDRVLVEVDVGGGMGYSSATALDKGWKTLAERLADFENDGAVLCTSGGDDYNDGPVDWYIGPEKMVWRAEIVAIDIKIKALRCDRKKYAKKWREAGDSVIATN
jgi:hypothetical protein